MSWWKLAASGAPFSGPDTENRVSQSVRTMSAARADLPDPVLGDGSLIGGGPALSR